MPMYCTNCGQEVNIDNKFCANCGKATPGNIGFAKKETIIRKTNHPVVVSRKIKNFRKLSGLGYTLFVISGSAGYLLSLFILRWSDFPEGIAIHMISGGVGGLYTMLPGLFNNKFNIQLQNSDNREQILKPNKKEILSDAEKAKIRLSNRKLLNASIVIGAGIVTLVFIILVSR